MSSNNSKDENPLPYNYKIDYTAEEERGRANRRRIGIMSGRGNADQAITNTFMGFNHRIAPTQIPANRERTGYTFFTRPDFNFDENNIFASSKMTELARRPINSASRAILGMLDPLCPFAFDGAKATGLGMDFHPDVPFDNKQAFIPLLSNRLVDLSGFPDNTLDTFTSEEGLKREVWSIADSHYAVNYAYSLNATFQNLDGDITTELFNVWLESISNLYDGTFIARMRNRIQREICYQTRIYRLKMDPTNRFVTKIGAANAAFPVNDNMGALMNMSSSNVLDESASQTNIQFHCVGAEYLEPALYDDFNAVVALFNPDMVEAENNVGLFVPQGNLRRLDHDELNYFNWYGYPRIDPDTKELTWYVYEDDYQAIMKEVNKNGWY